MIKIINLLLLLLMCHSSFAQKWEMESDTLELSYVVIPDSTIATNKVIFTREVMYIDQDEYTRNKKTFVNGIEVIAILCIRKDGSSFVPFEELIN
jgi:hypothetical protein